MELTSIKTELEAKEAQKKAKEAKKQERAEQRYWQSTATKAEVFGMIESNNQKKDEILRQMYIYTRALTAVLMDKGILTEEELNEATKPIIESIYGKQPEESIEMTAENPE